MEEAFEFTFDQVSQLWTRIDGDWREFQRDLIMALKYVDWTEFWVQAMLAFFFLQCVLLFVFRKNHSYIMFNLAVNSVLVMSAKNVNQWASHNWKLFAKKNYFDKNGMFFTLTISFLAILVCFFCTSLMIFEAFSLIIQLKRAQLSRQHAKKRKVQ